MKLEVNMSKGEGQFFGLVLAAVTVLSVMAMYNASNPGKGQVYATVSAMLEDVLGRNGTFEPYESE